MWTSCNKTTHTMNDKETELYRIVDSVVSCCATQIDAEGHVNLTAEDVLGMTGINAVADILVGKVNPSGRIVDTFLKDNHSSPAMRNFGAYKYTNLV